MTVSQQRNERALAHGTSHHEIRQPRDAEAGDRHIEQEIGVVAGKVAGNRKPVDSFMGVEGPLRPCRAGQGQAIVPQQIGRHAGRSMLLQVERAGADHACRLGDLARHQRRIAERTGSKGYVDLLGDQINLPVRDVKLDGDVGIAVEEDGKRLREDLLGYGCTDADPQVTARAFARRRHLGFGSLDRGKNFTAARHEQFALGGQRELSRCPGEEPHAQPVLDPCHQLRQGRGGEPQIVRRGGKAAAFGHPNEGVHFGGGRVIHEFGSRMKRKNDLLRYMERIIYQPPSTKEIRHVSGKQSGRRPVGTVRRLRCPASS